MKALLEFNLSEYGDRVAYRNANQATAYATIIEQTRNYLWSIVNTEMGTPKVSDETYTTCLELYNNISSWAPIEGALLNDKETL